MARFYSVSATVLGLVAGVLAILGLLAASPQLALADDDPGINPGLFCELNCHYPFCNGFPCWCATPGWQCRDKGADCECRL